MKLLEKERNDRYLNVECESIIGENLTRRTKRPENVSGRKKDPRFSYQSLIESILDPQLIPYSKYKLTNGELSEEQFKLVESYQPTPEERRKGFIHMISAIEFFEIPIDMKVTKVIAMLLGALGTQVPRQSDSDKPHSLWLYTEAHLLVYGK